jgi:deoxyribodipyrimidine photo-lyase
VIRSAKQVTEKLGAQEKDALYARVAEDLAGDESVPEGLRQMMEDPRITVRRAGSLDAKGRCVVYWMQRAQRGLDNHALDVAVNVANELGLPCVTYFAAVKNFPHANLRHYAFMNQGLPDVEEDCEARDVGFVMRRANAGKPGHESPERFFADVGAAIVIGDENPLRGPERWRVHVAEQMRVPFLTVDADVVVPSKLLEKAQFSAGVMRPRLKRMMREFLRPHENSRADVRWKRPRALAHDDVRADITRGWRDFDRSVQPVDAWKGGRKEAMKRLHCFVAKMLAEHERERNRPETDGTSKLSPYLHFGNIGPLTIALAVREAAKKHPKLKAAAGSFLDELITWRELSVNFVRYQSMYDSVECADNWARLTIAKHDRDEREALYTLKQLEQARTHDELWNAAQLQMVHHGWMHNYLRMYWAKKILEWTRDARTAMKWAIYLNDRYILDGRDPNGYAGIAWAILGKFDRAWGERPIFGKRRYMSGESMARKFDAKSYIRQMRALSS